MQIQGPGGADRSERIRLEKIAARLKAAGVMSGQEADQVEISDIGKCLSFLSQLPAVRKEKVEALRKEIERDRYDIDSKIDDILDSLLEDLGVPAASSPDQ